MINEALHLAVGPPSSGIDVVVANAGIAATLRVKRNVVNERYARVFDSLYS